MLLAMLSGSVFYETLNLEIQMKLKLMLLSVCMFGGFSTLLASDPVETGSEKSEVVASGEEKSAVADNDNSKDSKEEGSSSCGGCAKVN
jgi:hypothetical protein